MKGSMKWYLRCAIRTFLLTVVWSVLMWIFSGGTWHSDGESRQEIWELIYYMLIGYIVFSFSVSISFYRRDIPLAISMGVSRKNAFFGTCFFTFVNFMAALILAAALGAASGKWESSGNWIFWMAVGMAWANVLGMFLGIMHHLFGKVAAIITGVVIYFLVLGSVIFFMFYFQRDMKVPGPISAGWYAGISIVTVLVFTGIMVLHYRTIHKMAV